MGELYPEIEARETFYLDVGDGHTVYAEESGNPAGKPVVVLHGGPGAGSSPKQRRFFDPDAYRIVLLDQRGCGHSTPHADVEHNTTWDLVHDVELLRVHLGIAQWMVFGGSWGSTLALAYARASSRCRHRARTAGDLPPAPLRAAVPLPGRRVTHLSPTRGRATSRQSRSTERDDLITAYHRRLFGDDARRGSSALTAGRRGNACSYLMAPEDSGLPETDDEVLAFARIENHYFAHRGFFTRDSQLLDGVAPHPHIPAVIVQGRYDIVCPMRTAWDLHRGGPRPKLVVNKRAGHSMFDPENTASLVEACDGFRPL